MKKVYDNVLRQLENGFPTAMVTHFSKKTGQVQKEALELNREDRPLPDYIRSSMEDGIPAIVNEKEEIIFTEPFYPKERLVVLGGGHIAVPLVKFASEVGFKVTVVDDRPYFANQARFPWAEQVICESFEDSFDRLKLTEYDYIVIITRGHRHDTLCLRKILSQRESVYLGMIGSKRRVSGIKQMLIEEGYDEERLHRICTPIGLGIGAITPEEISISILAQLIQRKRLGVAGKRAINRSEIDLEVIKTISKQDTNSFAIVTVMWTKGSVPRGAGAKMIVYPDLSIAGSIGGGCSEGAIIRDAMGMIGTGKYLIKTIDLTGDVAESEGMVCGGIMEVVIEDFSEV